MKVVNRDWIRLRVGHREASENRIYRESAMIKVMKFVSGLTKLVFIFAVVVLLLYAACHEHCRTVVCEKALEGMVGGFLVGVALAFSKIERLRSSHRLTNRMIQCLVRREVCSGLVGG